MKTTAKNREETAEASDDEERLAKRKKEESLLTNRHSRDIQCLFFSIGSMKTIASTVTIMYQTRHKSYGNAIFI